MLHVFFPGECEAVGFAVGELAARVFGKRADGVPREGGAEEGLEVV